jgi:hypothetical protein
MSSTSKLVRNYINASFSLREAWIECFGQRMPYGKCFCPFHDNTDSPAAKVYEDRLVCFGACQRSYTAFDFLQKFRPDLLRAHSAHVLPEPEVDLSPHLLCRFGRGLTAEQLLYKFLGV